MKIASADRRETKGFGAQTLGAGLFCLIAAIALVLLAHGAAYSADVTLTWDASSDPDVTGYKIYYGTQSGTYSEMVDAGSATTVTLTDLVIGTTYYIAATAYDSYGYESDYSNEVQYTASADDPPVNLGSSSAGTSSGGGGGGGHCFIATAAFGSYLDPHVAILRSFRDNVLLTNRFGKAFVAWYYATSPPYADAISHRDGIRAGVRVLLLPLIAFAYLCLAIGVAPALLIVTTFLTAMVWGTRGLWVRRKEATEGM